MQGLKAIPQVRTFGLTANILKSKSKIVSWKLHLLVFLNIYIW